MLEKTGHILIWFFIMSMIFISCKTTKDAVKEVNNSSPRYGDAKFVELVKQSSLDVTSISIFSKESNESIRRVIDFDKENNMYVLDTYESVISVFNDKGEFVRAFGRAGQGPKDFDRPSALVIKNDKIFVFEGFFELKVVDLKGEFISKQVVQIENRLDVRAANDRFYLLRGKTDPTFVSLELILTVETDGFANGKELLRYKYPPGFKGSLYNCAWFKWLLIAETGEFYFPEDNLNQYSIIKYNQEGRPLLKFRRKYSIAPYSKEARDRIYSMVERQVKQGDAALPQSPPVVVNIFQDQRRNLWVFSGETYEDNLNPEFENTIDIFSEKGEWLYSFKTNKILKNCIYNDGKIYYVPPINQQTYAQSIEVYKIQYH